jgi:hypothetical protein
MKKRKKQGAMGKTMFIKIGGMSNETFINITGKHAHVDMSGVKIVVGAGGHPDGGTHIIRPPFYRVGYIPQMNDCRERATNRACREFSAIICSS